MLKLRYRVIWLSLVLLLLMTGCQDNKNNKSTEVNSQTLSYPILCVANGNYSYSYMQGYEVGMDIKSMHGSLICAKNKEALSFAVDSQDRTIERVEYTLYDNQGITLENGTIAPTDITDSSFNISLNKLSNNEACLEMKLCFDETQSAYYYSRIVSADNIDKSIQYICDIENACLKKESPVDLTLCMEWDLKTNMDSYYQADINSSYDQVTWAGLNITDKISDYYINLQDYSEGICSFSVDYIICDADANEYRVSDFLRVREVNDEMYLLNFYRTTGEFFTEADSSFCDTQLYLGVGDGKSAYLSIDDGKELYFVQEQSLYYFNSYTNKLSLIYESNARKQENSSVDVNKYNIYLLGKRDKYFYYVVAGYMSDTLHAGACGISIMRYDTESNQYEELLYQPVRYNYELVINELDMLSYMNDAGDVFFVSNGAIYSYNVESHTLRDEIKNINLDTLVVSPDGEYIAWSKRRDKGEDILAVKNLNTGNELSISPKDGTRISPIGFVKNDLVYGVSDINEVDSGVASDKQNLMYNVCIVNDSGELIKEYPQKGNNRVLYGETSDTVIVLHIGEPAGYGTVYKEIDQQQIVRGNKSDNTAVEKKEVKEGNKGNIWIFKFANSFKAAPSFIPASLNAESDIEKIALEPSEISTYYKDKYFLYARGRLYGVYDIMREALVKAADMAGVVTNVDNDKLYCRTAKAKSANLIPQKEDLAEILLSSEDGVVKAWGEENPNVNVLDITGIKTEDMLMFVSRGFPVLARYDDDSFVWIIAYTDSTIKCQKSDSMDTFEISIESADSIFAKTGYEYYTCND